MIVAVDFDGTLVEEVNFPSWGSPKRDNIDYVKGIKEAGNQIILWTCREGNALNMAVDWCRSQGIEFDAINENLSPKFQVENYGYNCRKIYADVYFDDKAKKS